MEYQEFLETKTKLHRKVGFKVSEDQLNPMLFPFQKHVVMTALEAGSYAIFEDCGLGKTFQQLEWARIVCQHEDMPVLILCPLAVAKQTINEGLKFGIDVKKYEGQTETGVYITNYEQLKKIEDCSVFVGVVLDESSILKNFNGKFRTLIIEKFVNTPYKLACTATPAPNDPVELGNHAEFLGVMKTDAMKAMYFINDVLKTKQWRLKKHSVDEFYKWVSSWAVMISNPSDIGFSAKGYDLPKLNMIEHQIKVPKKDNGLLFNDVSVSATQFNGGLRETQKERVQLAAEIANSTKGQVIVWIKHNEEGELLRALINGSVEVKGSDKPLVKEKNLIGFGMNEFRVLITKTKIAQFGLNYQNCHTQIFAAIDFSFEGLYQAIRRSYRFGQKNDVDVHVISTDTMQNVIKSIDRKRGEFEKMKAGMSHLVSLNNKIKPKVAELKEVVKADNYEIFNGDSVKLIKEVESESIDYSFFSPPFASLFTYSGDVEDMSNSKNQDEFFNHFRFLLSDVYRILKPGRLCSMHLTQLTTSKGRDGYLSIIDFRGDVIRLMQEIGFYFHAEVTIWKDPQLAAVRTKNIQLLHGQTKKDSTINRPGLADYIVTFRKPGINSEPVNHEKNGIPFEAWTKIASPVWMDIKSGDVISGWRKGREEKDEKHLTPTQLTPIRNLYTMYTNPNDVVFSPFSGVGSEGVEAVLMGRKFKGMELKSSYFQILKKNMVSAVEQTKQQTLF